jgi:MarR family 2-MHQ and catechol resistance regulon transcriptional repressor
LRAQAFCYPRPVEPTLDDPRITIYGLFIEAQRALGSVLERDLAGGSFPTRHADFDLILRLARSPGRRLRMADLAAQCGLSPSGLTRAVDRLVRDGLVERLGCPEDARGAYAVLTDEGETRVVATIRQHLASLEEHFFGVLDDKEIAQLAAISRKLRDRHNPAAAQVTDG